MSIIKVSDITKEYEGGIIKALNGVSLEIKEGEIAALMGPSGCGKSTLFNIIGCIDNPSSGRVIIDGTDINELKSLDLFRARTIGFVFQFHHLIPYLTILENVELPMYSLGVTKKERREKAQNILKDLGLSEKMHLVPTKISGGERQRAAIARALMNSPKIILADEPTGNLDTVTGEMVMDFLLRLCTEKKITMLLATHNLDIASKTNRIIRMKNGMIEYT